MLLGDAALKLKHVSELYGIDWMRSFYQQRSKKSLGNLLISCLINKICASLLGD